MSDSEKRWKKDRFIMEGVISKMESVENMMKEWKDSKIYHVSWMTEEKEKKFQKHLEQLHLLKKKKEVTF